MASQNIASSLPDEWVVINKAFYLFFIQLLLWLAFVYCITNFSPRRHLRKTTTYLAIAAAIFFACFMVLGTFRDNLLADPTARARVEKYNEMLSEEWRVTCDIGSSHPESKHRLLRDLHQLDRVVITFKCHVDNLIAHATGWHGRSETKISHFEKLYRLIGFLIIISSILVLIEVAIPVTENAPWVMQQQRPGVGNPVPAAAIRDWTKTRGHPSHRIEANAEIEVECPICYEPLQKRTWTYTCLHDACDNSFHRRCMVRLEDSQIGAHLCPLCRRATRLVR